MTGEIANKRCWIFYLSLANTMIEPKKIFGNFRKLSLASREDSRETRAISVKKFPNIFLARKSSIQERLIKNLSSWCEINGSREADKKSLPPVVKIAMSKSKAIKNLISLFLTFLGGILSMRKIVFYYSYLDFNPESKYIFT